MEQMDRYPSYVVSVAGALSSTDQPLAIDTLVDRVRGARPDTKGVRTGVYRALKQLYQAVPVAPDRYGWLSHLLRDNVVRHPLSNEEVRRGYLLLDELEHAILFPQFFQNHRPDNRKVTIELFGDEVLQAEAAIEKRTWSLKLGEPFVKWIDDQGGQGRDDIIISVRDAVAGIYQVRLLPREGRDEETIEQRSIAVAAVAEELVMDLRRAERAVPAWELVALLIGRGLYVDPVPPDDLHLLLQRHSMLALLEGEGYTVADRRETSNMVRAPFARRNDNFDPMFWGT
ncbi:MAG: hypothetical protein IPK16_19395 [Anaerolineales bacterium]|nr:hypothetical protein [Anaerolineales bacterium]